MHFFINLYEMMRFSAIFLTRKTAITKILTMHIFKVNDKVSQENHPNQIRKANIFLRYHTIKISAARFERP